MIMEFVNAFITRRTEIEAHLGTTGWEWDYDELARYLVNDILGGTHFSCDYDNGDFICSFIKDDVDYRFAVIYGTCGNCDTAIGIGELADGERPKLYADIMLHMIQAMETTENQQAIMERYNEIEEYLCTHALPFEELMQYLIVSILQGTITYTRRHRLYLFSRGGKIYRVNVDGLAYSKPRHYKMSEVQEIVDKIYFHEQEEGRLL